MGLISDTKLYLKVKATLAIQAVEHAILTFFEIFPEVKKWWFWVAAIIALSSLGYLGWWSINEYYFRKTPQWALKELTSAGYKNSTDELIRAIAANDEGAVKLFFQAKVDINATSSEGQITPLWQAVSDGNYTLAQLLINQGADVYFINREGINLPELALNGPNVPIYSMLLAAGATNNLINFVSAVKTLDQQALRNLIEKRYEKKSNLKGRWRVPEELIPEGRYLRYNIRQRDADGMEPIHWAAARGDPKIIDLLVEKGADVNVIEGKFRQSPLIIAAIAGNEVAAESLINHNADINARDLEGKSALFYSIVINHPALLNVLLKYNADPNTLEIKSGITAASIASFMNRPKMLEALIMAGADVSKPDMQGLSALDWAAYAGNMETVSVLLDMRNDTYMKNRRLILSAIRIANDTGKTNVAEYLENVAQ